MCVCTHLCMCVSHSLYVYVPECMCMYVFLCLCMYVYLCVCGGMCLCIYTLVLGSVCDFNGERVNLQLDVLPFSILSLDLTLFFRKLEAKNLKFCIKFFNYVVLFAQETFSASAGYVPVYIVFLLTLSNYILN